jgi:hypothetical protein
MKWKPRRPAVVRAVQQAMRDLCGRSRSFCLRNCALRMNSEDRVRLMDQAAYHLAYNAMRYSEWRASTEMQDVASQQITRYIDGDLCPKE